MLKSTIRHLLGWSAAIALLFLTVYILGARQIISLLTDQECVRSYSSTLLPWICVLPVVTVLAFIYDGFFIGLTLTRTLLLSTLIAVAAFYATAFLHISDNFRIAVPDNRLLWTAFEFYLFLRGFLLLVQTKKLLKPRH